VNAGSTASQQSSIASPQLAASLRVLNHFHQTRYDLIALSSPSHIHWLFRPLQTGPPQCRLANRHCELILHTVNSYSAHECKSLLEQSGAFWQGESYDHCVRDEGELERILDYIEMNPVKAGLCKYREDWPFSSASHHPVG
jgi:REP element-mobilizing transposase RayT